MIAEALKNLSDPNTPFDIYAEAVKQLGENLVERALDGGAFPYNGIHAVSTAADYQLLLEPSVELLRREHVIALSCLWPISKVLVEGSVDNTMISMALSEKGAADMPLLLVMAQSVGTVTELQSILAHIFFDMGPNDYKKIVVLSLVSHIDAAPHLRGILPERYREGLIFLSHRTDHQLSLDGTLVPGIGGPSFSRAGFSSQSETRSFVPAIFRSSYDFARKPKPGSATGPAPPKPFK
ncbi:hypothetical protein IB277_14800 [Ensifer sp. ENS07]|uniref:hypothetical protein n=1 Tax=Ensifer sp. ENS07 TaxID=2769274 RepID=UPI001783678A|nr:hypothetical protein [Ensifer sp. ENS07]MBD9637573.1 hypothetical protein [Ensifer sp. ENS07]